jgi:hypothetical protein
VNGAPDGAHRATPDRRLDTVALGDHLPGLQLSFGSVRHLVRARFSPGGAKLTSITAGRHVVDRRSDIEVQASM